MFDPTIPHPTYAFAVAPNMESWSSFPSDTAAYFFALALGLGRLLRRYTLPLMLYTAVWICVPRMFLGVHYLSDMVVGSIIGIAVVEASMRSAFLRHSVANRVLRFNDRKPHLFYAVAFLICFEMGALFDDIREVAHGVFHGVSRAFGSAHPFFALVAGGVIVLALTAGLALALTRNLKRLPGGRRAPQS